MRKKIYFILWLGAMLIQAFFYRRLMKLYTKELNSNFKWLLEKSND